MATDPFSDPVVVPPRNGWEYVEREGKELLACPECFEKHKKGD